MRFFVLFFCLCFVAFSCTYRSSSYLRTETTEGCIYRGISGSFSGKRVLHSPDPLVSYRWSSPSASDDLESYVVLPVSVTADRPEHVMFSSGDRVPFRITGDCSLCFDFGQVNAGWLEFDSEDSLSDVVMSISEFNEPAVFNVGSEHPKKSACPIRSGNTYRLVLNRDLYEGVRFGWIDFKGVSEPITILDVRLVCQIKPTNYEGSFACSDTMLTRIWYTGAYGVKLNLLRDYFGAILMERSDRHSWTGDAHVSQAVSMVAFGNFDFVRKNLFYTSDQFNGIASYSLYWVLSLLDYYNYTGDSATLFALTDNACGKLDLAYSSFGSDPFLLFYGWDERLGAGFEGGNCAESQNAYKMLSIGAWLAFGRAMFSAGRPDLGEKYCGFAEEKCRVLRESGEWFSSFGVFAAADAVNAGFTSVSERDSLWVRCFSDRLQRVSYSPFNEYFIIGALARLGRYEEALNSIDDCWGGQIRYGGTTFFEVFRPSWNRVIGRNGAPINNQCGYTSLTHPWSSGVTKWLSEEVLGIKPLSPGFSSFCVYPHLSERVSWVCGDVPTLHGRISASFDLRTGRCGVHVPEGLRASIGIPKGGLSIGGISVTGGNLIPDGEDEDFVYFHDVPGGDYVFRVRYEGDFPPRSEEVFSYVYDYDAVVDSVTGGNWKGVYGGKGYVLFNYDGLGKDRVCLPDFTDRLVFNKRGDFRVDSVCGDRRALVSDLPGDGSRCFGSIVTRDPIACEQTMTIDIVNWDRGDFRVALYFADWERGGRRSALEVFDLTDKRLLMPVQLIDSYGEGKYLVFRADRSIRLRINQVRGANVSLSGIFFD